jgi:eukaryotic-like serine/threonine-protein kinase
MSIRQTAELIAKVARTVHYAHEHGILHRDIKPGNILLDAKSEPLLTDFGLARLVEAESTVTRTKEVMGTPSYMAPEQAVGNNAAVSNATDVYGLGAVLYQLLTGHPPFAGGTTYETIKLVLDTEPRQPRLLNPKIDRDLSTICLKSLEKDPKRRYASALALAEDLEHWLKHEPIQARRTGFFTRGKKWVRRNRAIAALMASLIALAAIIGWNVWQSEIISGPPTKSVAVLPFSNLSKEEESASFAGGMQDQILTDLARVADLKVISRTSTIQYTSEVARNLRDVGRQLGVAHVVEGSVQRVGNRVRVSAQLIDARTDRHLWAQSYDRELADVFVIQTDLAEKIASALEAKLSPKEKARLDRRPTKDSDAYLLYVQAHDIANRLEVGRYNFLKAEELYEQAIKLDPNFALAFAGLSEVESWMYHSGEPTTARREKARLNADESLRLQPDLPEGHLALGLSYYRKLAALDKSHAEVAGAVALAHLIDGYNPRMFETGGSFGLPAKTLQMRFGGPRAYANHLECHSAIEAFLMSPVNHTLTAPTNHFQ